IVGVTPRRAPPGGSQVFVYFRAEGGGVTHRRLRLLGRGEPLPRLVVLPPPPPSPPRPGGHGDGRAVRVALACGRVGGGREVPAGAYATYVGEWVGSDPGEGALLGLIQ